MLTYLYKCFECQKNYPINEKYCVCPDCSQKQKIDSPLRGILEVECSGSLDSLLSPHDLLPIEKEYFPAMKVGGTPLVKLKRFGEELGFKSLYVKNDSLNPTGSLKDRASYLVAAAAKKWGIDEIVGASTGNAGSSMAGIGAAAGLDVTLFLPKTAPRGKLVQSLQYGARLMLVEGNYDLAYDLSMEYFKKVKALSRNTAYNPLTIEGKKTAAIEIYLDLKGKVPDHLFVPTGDGVIIAGIYKGLRDLLQLGFIKKMPTVYAVQAEGSAAIHDAFQRGHFEPIQSKTVADSIAVDIPRNGLHALWNLQQQEGKTVVVTDKEILEAQLELSRKTGIFAEPAAAASFAGFLKVKDDISPKEIVTLLITGNGLKDVNSAETYLNFPEKTISSITE